MSNEESAITGVSITSIIITYNHEKTIAAAIESVLIQKCNFHHQIYISDDCSTDNTTKICKEYRDLYPDKIKLNVNETNKGPGNNWTDAFYTANTKYIAYLDGDDYWCNEDKLEIQITKLEENTNCVFCCHNTQVVPTNRKMVPVQVKKGVYTKRNFKYQTHISGRVFNRQIVKDNLDDPIDLGDAYMQALMLSLGHVYYIRGIMSIYQPSGIGSWSGLSHAQQQKNIRRAKAYMKRKFGYVK